MTYCYTGQAGGRSSNSNSSDSFGGGDAGTMVQAQLATRVFLDSRDAGRTPTMLYCLLKILRITMSPTYLSVSMRARWLATNQGPAPTVWPE